MKLFYAPRTSAFVPQLVLEEAGATFELTCLNLKKGEQRSPEMLGINPLGRVPVLITDKGPLTEVPAILSYIAAVHPEADLEPEDPFEKAKLAAFNAFVSSSVHVAIAHLGRPQRWADEESAQAAMRTKAVANYGQLFEMIDRHMVRGPWLMGDQFTTGDAYLFFFSRLLELANLNRAAFPTVRGHYERMIERPAAQRALETEALVLNSLDTPAPPRDASACH